MTNTNQAGPQQLTEDGNILPGGFLGLYHTLSKKGWKQSAAPDSGNDTKKKRRNETVEVQRIVLEKPYTGPIGGIERIQMILRFVIGQLVCLIHSDPLVPAFTWKSIKDIGSTHLLMQEIDDWGQRMNSPQEIQAVQHDIRESMRTARKFIRVGGVLKPVDADTGETE